MTLSYLNFTFQNVVQFADISGARATTYTEARNNYLKRKENDRLWRGTNLIDPGTGDNVSRIHNDGRGIPTLGYGYNLKSRSYAEIEAFLTYAFGGILSNDQLAGLEIIRQWKTNPYNPSNNPEGLRADPRSC